MPGHTSLARGLSGELLHGLRIGSHPHLYEFDRCTGVIRVYISQWMLQRLGHLYSSLIQGTIQRHITQLIESSPNTLPAFSFSTSPFSIVLWILTYYVEWYSKWYIWYSVLLHDKVYVYTGGKMKWRRMRGWQIMKEEGNKGLHTQSPYLCLKIR